MPTETLPCEVFHWTCAFESSWFLFKWFGSIPFSSPESSSVSRPSTFESGTITLPNLIVGGGGVGGGVIKQGGLVFYYKSIDWGGDNK